MGLSKFGIIGASLGGLGSVIIVLAGILGWIVLPNVVDNTIKDTVILEPDGETYESWFNIPVPINLKFYVFNITNPDEFDLNSPEGKPQLQQLGPYIYKQKRTKEEIYWYDRNARLNFTQRLAYEFDTVNSVGSEDDFINTLNIGFYLPLFVLHGLTAFGPFVANTAANNLNRINKASLVQRDVRVGDLLFAGIDYREYVQAAPLLEILFPAADDNRFGYYFGTNGTLEKPYQIDTGKNGHEHFGEIYTYDGAETLNLWGTQFSHCNMLNGTDASVFPPFVEKDRIVKIYTSDLCRSFDFIYDSEMEHLDIPGYRFIINKAALESPAENPDNGCFCLNHDLTQCFSGTLDLGRCLSPLAALVKVPLIASKPHFLHGDTILTDSVGGLVPNVNEHETFLDIEPNSGVLLIAHKRIQINVELFPLTGVQLLENVQHRILPIFWVDEVLIRQLDKLTFNWYILMLVMIKSAYPMTILIINKIVLQGIKPIEEAIMDEENADDLKNDLIKPLRIINISKWTALGVGIFSLCLGIVIFIFKKSS